MLSHGQNPYFPIFFLCQRAGRPAEAKCPKDDFGKANFSEVSPGDNEQNHTQPRYWPSFTKNTLHCLPYRNITAYITYIKITIPKILWRPPKHWIQLSVIYTWDYSILAVLISHLDPLGHLRTNLSYQPPQEVCFAKSFFFLIDRKSYSKYGIWVVNLTLLNLYILRSFREADVPNRQVIPKDLW